MAEKKIIILIISIVSSILIFGSCAFLKEQTRNSYTPADTGQEPPISQADAAREDRAKTLYFEAESCYYSLRSDIERRKYRCYWMDCIQKFQESNRSDPSGPWAAAALYMSGILYEDLYKYSFSSADLQEAKSIFDQVMETYPKSDYSKKAQEKLKNKYGLEFQSSEANKENTSSETSTETATIAKDSCTVVVTGIRYWSNPEYTRVVIDTDRETTFQHNLLKKDPRIDRPNQRLYVDLKNSRLGNIEKSIPINDDLLESARAAQYAPDTVRVVVDLKSFESYDVFSLQNPFRIIIDVRGKSEGAPETLLAPKTDTASIAKQLALGVKRIAVDAGHGGKDFGAPGCVKGVQEKDVVMQIAKKLAAKIRTDLNCEVIMTRDSDDYLTLEERTAIANTKKADLFVSIHANASRSQSASGIETYFLNLTTDDESISVAARENATSKKNISELQTILNDLMRNAKINESSRLATYVQKSLCNNLTKSFNRINDKGIKQAPFYVLLGAQMPAILVETSFISNPTDCSRLTDPKYQDALCEGIVKGIGQYVKEIQPAANFGKPAREESGS